MSQVEKIEVSYNKNGGLIKASPNIFKLIRENFSIKNPVYQMRRFAPRLYAITPSGAFQIGLWYEIEFYLNSLNIPIDIQKTEEFEENLRPQIFVDKISTIDGFTYYDYQEDTIKEFLIHGRGISILPTAAGKSLCIAGLCKTLLDNNPKSKILIIVPNASLLNQLHISLEGEYNLPFSTRWGDGKTPDLTKNILISNSQMLVSDIKTTLTIVQNYDYVIIDEVHTLGEKKNKINKIIQNIKTPNKFGLTGTLPDSLLANWNIIGKVGGIVYEKSSYEIREQGTASDVEVRAVYIKYKDSPVLIPTHNRPTANYDAEIEFIYNNSKRNDFIAKLVSKLNGNCLIIVDRKIHGHLLYDCIQSYNKKVFFVQGSTDTDEGIEIQNLLEKENNIACIAMSKIFSTGINIKNLHYAIFVGIGKSTVKVCQSIGRTMRKHESKEKAIIYDFFDNLSYSKEHFKKRVKIYKKQKIDFSITEYKL